MGCCNMSGYLPEYMLDKHTRPRVVRRRQREIADDVLDQISPRGHRFAFFRVGVDLCWKCKKTSKEHTT
jgi:hypothetical protein